MRSMAGNNLGETLEPARETRIHLCGQLTVRINGVRVEESLPGRQGRVLFAYLATHRTRATPRTELMDVLWPEDAPAAAESALAALLAKLRRVLGDSAIAGRQDIRLHLPPNAWIDVEAASDGLHRAESALANGDWARAWGPSRVALHIADREFMPGYAAPWMTAIRDKLFVTLVRACECVAAGGLEIGGAEILNAERAARRLTIIAPLNESGCRLLMRALAARDNIGDALTVYERLRVALREELGASPSPATQALHRQLLQGGRAQHAGSQA
jgi:SARP family transcriptional regulator, regulator of embCAB operon